MKKIIFTAYNLDAGGIERALITLLKSINYEKYSVTLLLEKKEGVFIEEIPKDVKVLEYKISTCSFVPLRKIINRLKLVKTILFNRNKYDFACCYAPYSIPGALLTRHFSKNNCIWIHTDYYYLYNGDNQKIKNFFNERYIVDFKHIIFVANEARDHFVDIYPKLKNKTVICNNLVDKDYIVKMANEQIEDIKPIKPLFINIARHDEHSKKITRLIEAASLLKQSKFDFEIWLIGNGDDTKKYEDKIKKLQLEEKIKLLGFKNNPYPYYKLADAFILTSEYEGFPVVYLESLIFDVPIITTIDVSGDGLTIKGRYGLIAPKSARGVFEKMKQFIDEKYEIKQSFDALKYNSLIQKKIEDMFNNKW